jgi:hypothetical protein
MEHGDTIAVKLLVSGTVQEVYEKLEGQYKEVAKASEAKGGCVTLDKSMKATLSGLTFAVKSSQGSLLRPITHDTTWRWRVTANTVGKNTMDVLLGPVLQHAGLELRPAWIQPTPLHATVTVKARPLGKVLNPIERNWWWLLPVGIALVVAAVWLVERRP